MSVPTGEAAWMRLIRAGMALFWRELAERSGASVWEDGGVIAAIFPRAPDRSIFNSVFYEDGKRLIGSLDSIAAAYDEAGVRAWTVWVPVGDESVVRALEGAGHVLDAEPRAMGMEVAALRAPEVDPAIELREEPDMAEVARLNEIAYGWAPGEFEAVAKADVPESYAHFASLDGETAGCAVTWDHGDDAELTWVATLPEARGRGVASALTAKAVQEARERGRLTTTLVATKLGYPVYLKLGYRHCGTLEMWERRKPL